MAKKVYITEFDASGKPYYRTLNEMENRTHKASQKISQSFQKIGAGIATYFGGRELLNFANDAIQLGTKLAGVEKGFNRLKSAESILMKLRKVTQGTVTDLQLMQSAVKADNFRIPLSLLAKGLEFVNKRAIQTGESVDYMMDSFMEGTSKQSLMRLDNLGISQMELSEEVKRTGDFYVALGNIIERENLKMAGMIDDTVTAQQRLNTQLENTKTQLGKNVLPYWGSFLGMLNQVVANFGNINTLMTGGGFMLNAKNNAMSDAMFGGDWAGSVGYASNYKNNVGSSLESQYNQSYALWMAIGKAQIEARNKKGGGKVDDTAWQYYLGNLSGVDSFGDASGKKMGNKYDYKPPFIGQMQDVAVPELKTQFDDIGLSFVNKFSETENIAYNIGRIFNVSADSFVGKLMQAFDVGGSILSMLSSIGSLAGGGGIFSLLGLAEGGTVINKGGKLSYAPIPKFARGGSYMVPAGYSNDSGLIRVQSGERVDVTPSGQVPMISKMLQQINSSIQAGNMNNTRKGKQPVIVNVMLDGRDVSKRVTGNQNRLGKRGVNLSEL